MTFLSEIQYPFDFEISIHRDIKSAYPDKYRYKCRIASIALRNMFIDCCLAINTAIISLDNQSNSGGDKQTMNSNNNEDDETIKIKSMFKVSLNEFHSLYYIV